MTVRPSKNLMEQQVDLVRPVLEWRAGMAQHLIARVMPHLDPDAKALVIKVVEFLDEEDGIDETLSCFLDVAIGEIRHGIAAGTYEERVAIPRERLIGCTEAFDTYRRLTPAAEALQAALPPLEELFRATRRAIDFAEAIRLSLRMVDGR